MSCASAVIGFDGSVLRHEELELLVHFSIRRLRDTWTGSAAVDEHLSIERDETRYSVANEPSKRVSFTAHLSLNALCSHAHSSLLESLTHWFSNTAASEEGCTHWGLQAELICYSYPSSSQHSHEQVRLSSLYYELSFNVLEPSAFVLGEKTLQESFYLKSLCKNKKCFFCSTRFSWSLNIKFI